MPRRSNTGPKALPVTVGARVRRAREARGLSRNRLAGEDLEPAAIRRLEVGRRPLSMRLLLEIAHRLDVPLGHFVNVSEVSPEAAATVLLDAAANLLRERTPYLALEVLDQVTKVPSSLETRSLWLRAWALTDAGRPRDALPLLETVRANISDIKDARERFDVEYISAMALYNAGLVYESTAHLRAALHIAHDPLHDDTLQGRTTVAIGHTLYIQGNLDHAVAHYMRALELFGNVLDLDNQACVYTGLSRVYRRKGDLEKALKQARLAVTIFESRGNARLAAHELANIAEVSRDLGKLDEALEAALQAAERASAGGVPDVEALAYSTQAEIRFRRNELSEAVEAANRAIELSTGDEDLPRMDAQFVLAKVAEREKNHERADHYFRLALAAFERSGNHTAYRDAALAYTNALHTRGDVAAALDLAVLAAQANRAAVG